MQASMNDEFSRKFEEAQLEDMLKVLREFFDTPNDVEWNKSRYDVSNTWIREEASIIDHVLYIIEQIEQLSKLDFPLHEQRGKDVVLNSYLSFLSHFKMTNPVCKYHGLLGLLQTFDKDHQLHKEMMNVVGASSLSRHHPFKKGKKKKNKKMQSAGNQT